MLFSSVCTNGYCISSASAGAVWLQSHEYNRSGMCRAGPEQGSWNDDSTLFALTWQDEKSSEAHVWSVSDTTTQPLLTISTQQRPQFGCLFLPGAQPVFVLAESLEGFKGSCIWLAGKLLYT